MEDRRLFDRYTTQVFNKFEIRDPFVQRIFAIKIEYLNNINPCGLYIENKENNIISLIKQTKAFGEILEALRKKSDAKETYLGVIQNLFVETLRNTNIEMTKERKEKFFKDMKFLIKEGADLEVINKRYLKNLIEKADSSFIRFLIDNEKLNFINKLNEKEKKLILIPCFSRLCIDNKLKKQDRRFFHDFPNIEKLFNKFLPQNSSRKEDGVNSEAKNPSRDGYFCGRENERVSSESRFVNI